MQKHLSLTVLIITFLSYDCQSVSDISYKGYNTYEPGNMNIFISAPHGGDLAPTDIPDRQSMTDEGVILSDYTTNTDLNTKYIAKTIRDALVLLFKEKNNIDVQPHLLNTNLKRIKMDANRNEQESCQRLTDDCNKVYKEYHSFMKSYQSKFDSSKLTTGNYLQGILIDIHGQMHPEQRIEIGYSISSNTLNQLLLSDNLSSTVSKMRQLNGNTYSVEEMIRGATLSLGAILEKKFGYKACPSPTQKPDNSSYFAGGYTVKTWGSFYPSVFNLNAIQIELPSSMRSTSTYAMYAKNVAAAIYDWYFLHGLDKRV